MEKRKLLIGAARTLVIWATSALGLLLMARLIPGVQVEGWGSALLAVLAIGLLNALLWPVLSRVTLPFLVFTFGFGALLLNGFIIGLAHLFVPGFYIKGWQAMILVPIGVTIVSTLISSTLTLDDDASYYRSVIGRGARSKAKTSLGGKNDKPGFVLLEIDGLSEPVLRRALQDGEMPTLARWLKQGTHKIKAWETDLSCQTGSSQAGILHGKNQDIPAFRWVEKDKGNRIMVSTGPMDAPEIERRISNRAGLLAQNGASRTNLFSGDAEDVMFTYSQLTNMSRFYNSAWHFFYSSPYNLPHTIVLAVWDIVLELYSRWRKWRQDVQPRLTHIGIYPVVRAFANVFMREMTTYILIGDISDGKHDVIYSTFMGYDEIAHHSGVEDEEAFFALRRLDRHFAFLEQAAMGAARPYSFIVLSDHGQSKGATFKQRYGLTLEDLVVSLMPEKLKIYSELDANQDHFGQALIYPIEKGRELAKRGLRHMLKAKKEERKRSEEGAQVIVLASGNLGLIYFCDWRDNLTSEKIESLFPALIPGLVRHEGMGFIMVRSDASGPVVIGSQGRHYLETGRIIGQDPLDGFGPRTARHLLRTAQFSYIPDILVNSIYDIEKNEVAAFEELIGSHGGAGGDQSRPFLMYPADWDLENEEIVGAEELHRALKSRMEAVWSGQAPIKD
ncbi:MAG TPA: phage holin family protein [Methanotrichaceae archaeon]|nr:phage holin family protein [Methanotrichaceae archaeon]